MPQKKKSEDKVIKKKTRVTVSNTMNQMIFEQKDMTLQAFRMFMFYLAKINPKRPEFTMVKVPLETYADMLGVELNEKAIDESTNMLLGYILKTGRVDMGEYIVLNAKYSMFSICRLTERKSDGKRMLEFKCSEDVKPLIFEMKEKFTAFNVWNVLNLGNFQDIRMYMLLSQYKVAGTRTLTLKELKGKLGISKDAYPEYKIFARDVLRKCQKALKERTDISFEFKAVGRPAHSVCFEISPNTEYTILPYLDEDIAPPALSSSDDPDQLTIEDYDEDALVDQLIKDRNAKAAICLGCDVAMFDEFTPAQIEELRNLAWDKVSEDDFKGGERFLTPLQAHQIAVSHYIAHKIDYCNAYHEPVENRYRFIKKAVAEDWN